MASFCAGLLRTLGRPARNVSVVFVSARKMRAMNRHYLGRDYETDVLSFCYEDAAVEGSALLGEILVAPEVAVRQAGDCGEDPARELRKLLAHGLLHLLGYDHETDRGRMNRVQARLMRQEPHNSPAMADLEARR